MPDHCPFQPDLPIGAALRALPLDTPPRSALPALQHAHARRRRTRRLPPWWVSLSAAAMLALAIGLPVAPTHSDPALSPEAATLSALQAESARLEALLAAAAADPLRPADVVMVGLGFEDELRGIDLALMQDGLEAAEREALWRQRVGLLTAYADLESSRRVLVADGQSYQTTLVSTY